MRESSKEFTAGVAVNELSRPGMSEFTPEAQVLALSVGVDSDYVPLEPASIARGDHSLYRRFGKRMLDLGIVLFTLPITLSVTAICALALWIQDGNPFYSQHRLGRNGRIFRIYKLRTMTRNADELLTQILKDDAELRREWQLTQKLKNDPRITPLGNFLRKSSIDELPQILNVVKGDMSLVGPRPMMPNQLKLYGDARAYFDLDPGMSGFWQVQERNESPFRHRALVDEFYAKNINLGADLGVILKTAWIVLMRTGN